MWALLELLFICLDRGFSFRAWYNFDCDFLLVRYLLETSGLHTFHIICVVTYKPGYAATSDFVNLLWNENFRTKITVFSHVFSFSEHIAKWLRSGQKFFRI